MRFCVVNLGCKVNRVESDSFAAALMAAGGVQVGEEDADVIVVNTCTVTGEAEKKTRKAVRRALRVNEAADVVVTGCAVAIDADAYRALDPRVRALGKVELAQAIEAGEWGAPAPHEAAARAGAAAPLPVGEGFRSRVGVKVQDGCDNACTFCIVHTARGRAASRPADEVAAECTALARAGVREIVLTGINLGSYRDGGRRDAGATRLAGLLERLLAETEGLHGPGEPACRFRISSIEPRDVDDALVALMARADGRICRHLHLPLQSGCTKVLREMARPYTADQFRALVERLYAAMPQLALSTDVICGFPGEADEDFEQTLALARACRFSKVHVFPYSKRAGTPAAARPDQVPPQVRAARAARLRALAAELRAADRARRAGTAELALVEGGGAAMSESYHEVAAPAGAAPGALVPVAL